MRPAYVTLAAAIALMAAGCQPRQESAELRQDRLTPVAELAVNPGNAAVTPEGRIFSTVHQFRRAPVQLIEITGKDSYAPFPPSGGWNDASRPAAERFVSLLGIRADGYNRIWVIDNGRETDTVFHTPKLLAFDTVSGQLTFRHDFAPEVIRPGGFPQDFVLDTDRGFAYIADAGMVAPPAIVVVDLKNNRSWRLEGLPQFKADAVNLEVEGKVQTRQEPGKPPMPARIDLDPITLSGDGETLFFGAMNSKKWYSLPAHLLRTPTPKNQVEAAIALVGEKPVSDGAITDAKGNHYFTDLNHNAIARMGPEGGKAEIIVQDPRLRWPDGLNFGTDGALYVTVNQLHLAPIFNHGEDGGTPPYAILRYTPE